MKILIYAYECYLKPAGGMGGYCYNILAERNRRKDNEILFIEESFGHILKRRIKFCIKKMLSPVLDKRQKKDINKRMMSIVLNARKASTCKSDVQLSDYDVVHFHSTQHMYSEKERLKDYKGIVLLTTHSPKVSYKELIDDYISSDFYMDHKSTFDGAEEFDKYAFERADYIIFPCKGAEEPYYHSWKLYEKVRDIKKIKYIPTGILPVECKQSREIVRKQLGIPDDAIVISFVGRHNEVKGYDILQEIFNGLKDVYVVCCGNVGNIQPPHNDKWIEVGWTTDPYSYVGASDIYMLPNRETYFDIAMLQTLSIGKCSVISNTGGNKEFISTPGVKLYNTVSEAVNCIEEFINTSRAERIRIEKLQREDFEKKYTIDVFYDKYKETIRKIIEHKGKDVEE